MTAEFPHEDSHSQTENNVNRNVTGSERENLNIIKDDLIDITKKLDKLVKHIGDEKLFSWNTVAHIVLPAFLGAFCAILISHFNLITPNNKIEDKSDQNAKYAAYIFVASVLSTVVTSGIVGFPNSGDKRIKTWITSMILAISLPSTYDTIQNQQKELKFSYKYQERLSQQLASVKSERDLLSTKASNLIYLSNHENYSTPQVYKTIDFAEFIVENVDNKNAIKKSIDTAINLISQNPNLIKEDKEIQDKYIRLYRLLSTNPELNQDYGYKLKKALGEVVSEKKIRDKSGKAS